MASPVPGPSTNRQLIPPRAGPVGQAEVAVKAVHRGSEGIEGLLVLGLPEAVTDLVVEAGPLVVRGGREPVPFPLFRHPEPAHPATHLRPLAEPKLVVAEHLAELAPHPVHLTDVRTTPLGRRDQHADRSRP